MAVFSTEPVLRGRAQIERLRAAKRELELNEYLIARMGFMSANGGAPCTISMTVMPSDHTS